MQNKPLAEIETTTPDALSLDVLVPFVYAELRRLASGYLLGRREPLTLQPAALVHQAYLRLSTQKKLKWQNRGHFYEIAARCMRQILVDQARSRLALKQGGVSRQESFDAEPAMRIIAFDDAIAALAVVDPDKSRAVELHYFAGLEPVELADAMGVSITIARRQLQIAEAWLHREITRRQVVRPRTNQRTL